MPRQLCHTFHCGGSRISSSRTSKSVLYRELYDVFTAGTVGKHSAKTIPHTLMCESHESTIHLCTCAHAY